MRRIPVRIYNANGHTDYTQSSDVYVVDSYSDVAKSINGGFNKMLCVSVRVEPKNKKPINRVLILKVESNSGISLNDKFAVHVNAQVISEHYNIGRRATDNEYLYTTEKLKERLSLTDPQV